MQMLDKNLLTNKNLHWVLKFNNLNLIFKLIQLTIPFVLFKSLDTYFFLKYYLSTSLTDVYYTCLAVMVMVVSIVSFLYVACLTFSYHKLVITQDCEVDYLFFNIYKKLFYLAILIFDFKNYETEFEKKLITLLKRQVQII
ncbi:hypothetical protein SCLARK_001757 [Spiroplasma clarkii]|nr:hypothetical protein SCLARK_001757 [Spiroplasma clarkii]